MTSKTSHETYLPQLSQCHVQHTYCTDGKYPRAA